MLLAACVVLPNSCEMYGGNQWELSKQCEVEANTLHGSETTSGIHNALAQC